MREYVRRDDIFDYVVWSSDMSLGQVGILLELRGKGWHIIVRVSHWKVRDEGTGQVEVLKGEVETKETNAFIYNFSLYWPSDIHNPEVHFFNVVNCAWLVHVPTNKMKGNNS